MGRIYWSKILIKYQNTYILTFLAPKCDILPPYSGHEWHKNIILFIFEIVPYILCCLKVIFWWFGMSHWWKILMKYQNTHILTIMAPKCDPLPPYPGHESRKYHYFFHFCSSSLHIMLLKDNFLVVWYVLLGRNFD